MFVHYHAFQRYNEKINLFGRDWEDPEPNYTLTNFGKPEISQDELLFIIRDYMK